MEALDPIRSRIEVASLKTLQQRIADQALTGPNPPRHLNADASCEFPVPKFGQHDLESPSNPAVWQAPELVGA